MLDAIVPFVEATETSLDDCFSYDRAFITRDPWLE